MALKLITSYIKNLALESYWEERFKETYGIIIDTNNGRDPLILRETYQILSLMPIDLVKACGVTKLSFRDDMGPNEKYTPNHGYYLHADRSVTMNTDIYYHPDKVDDFYDHTGYFLSRPIQTLLHEFGHAADQNLIGKGELSLKSDWLKLSGWSEEPKPGLKKLIIDVPGSPKIIGDWFYSPESKFTRFYGKRSPWEDWADCWAYYIGMIRDKLPKNKIEYFDNLLKKYF